LATAQFQLAARIVADLIANCATGVIHGAAGTGKTYASRRRWKAWTAPR